MKTARAALKTSPAANACQDHGVPNCSPCHGRAHEEWGVLSDDDLKLLNASRITNVYKTGEVIFSQGQPCSGIYCIDSGEVALRKTDERGASAIVRLARAGQTIGYRALFAGGLYTASAEALTQSQVCFIPTDVVRGLLEKDPRLGYTFLKRQADDLRESEEMRLHATSLSTRARLAHFLLALKDRVGSVGEDGTLTMEIPLARKDLAALLGARRESIARAIRALEDAGVAKFKGRTVLVPDLDVLLDELDGPGSTF